MEESIYETISPFTNHWVTLSKHWVTLTRCFYNIILLWILPALKYYESIDLFQDIKILVNKPDEESS
jgi:hypothetical protein